MGAEILNFLTQVSNLVFVLSTDFGILGFEFVERLADDVEFVDLGTGCRSKPEVEYLNADTVGVTLVTGLHHQHAIVSRFRNLLCA